MSNGVFVIPRRIRVQGRKVRTPAVTPPLVPVVRRGRTVAYTSRNVTPAISVISRNVSPYEPVYTDPARARGEN